MMLTVFWVGVAAGIVVAYNLFRYWPSPLRQLIMAGVR